MRIDGDKQREITCVYLRKDVSRSNTVKANKGTYLEFTIPEFFDLLAFAELKLDQVDALPAGKLLPELEKSTLENDDALADEFWSDPNIVYPTSGGQILARVAYAKGAMLVVNQHVTSSRYENWRGPIVRFYKEPWRSFVAYGNLQVDRHIKARNKELAKEQ